MGALVLFDVNPKENVADLYDRKPEISSLSNALKRHERLTIVYGVRRVGKTSLIHAFLNKKEVPYALIDTRSVYLEHASIPKNVLYELIGTGFLNFIERMGLETEESLQKKYPTIFSSRELTSLLKDINDWCEDRKMIYALVFDEAQYLRFGGSVRYDMLLAWSIDNLQNIYYIITGSEVGMLKEFLKYEDVDAPLYGRFRNEIVLEKFSKRTAGEFLSAGFKELNKHMTKRELSETIKSIDGVVGWLTYYGHYRGIAGLKQETAVNRVFEEGSKIVIKEIEALIAKSRKRYLSALAAIDDGKNRWGDIKRFVSMENGLISDTRMNEILQNLIKFGVIEKTQEGTYAITDPIVAYAIKKLV